MRNPKVLRAKSLGERIARIKSDENVCDTVGGWRARGLDAEMVGMKKKKGNKWRRRPLTRRKNEVETTHNSGRIDQQDFCAGGRIIKKSRKEKAERKKEDGKI